MMNIGMGSLLGNISKNNNERATLSSAQGFGSTAAQLIAGILIPQCLILFGDNAAGYGKTSVVVAIVGGIIIFLHYFLTEERNKQLANIEKTEEEMATEKFAITDIRNIVAKNRAFLALVLHSISICAVQAMGSVAALYMYADVMGDIGLQSIGQPLSTSLMFVILIASPVLSKKWDLVLIMLN